MRVMRTLLCLLLFSVVCVGQTIQDRVKKFENPKAFIVKYDKFKKETDVTYQFKADALDKKAPTRSYLDMAVIVTIPDGEKGTASLYFGKQGLLYDHSTFRLLLDGKLTEIPVHDYDYSTIIDITELLKPISESKIVEFQIGLFEGRLDAKQITALKNLATLL